LALAVFVSFRPASSAPGDIFTVTAPASMEAPKAAASIGDGDASVATQTGALTYSYAVKVPPGRHGVQPSLSLSYSSQAPIYGTLASGWSLSGLPIITEDTNQGRIAAVVGGVFYAPSMCRFVS
jgi:hypothetical protein